MKFVFASYVLTQEFDSPESWLNRIRAYAGILESLGTNNKVVSIEQINYEGQYDKSKVTYRFIRLSRLGRYFPLKLHWFIKGQRPDVIVIQGLHFPLQVIQLRFLLGSKVKIIVQNHAEKPFKGIKKYWQRWASNYINAYLFASQDMGLDWVKKGNLKSPAKIHEVMELSSVFSPIDKETALTKTQIKGNPAFLWVGRLNANKDPLNVISAFLKYTEILPSATLYMIYHTDELLPDISSLLKDHPRKDAIVLIGKMPNDELLYWYNSVDFIISGSYYEGSGTAICEAMSCGCIPVVTDIFSFRMITNDGQCGILYEAGSEVALLNALIQTQQINIPEKRKASLAYFKSNLSFNAIACRVQAIACSI